MGLSRRKAECLGVGPGGELYDALIDEHEPGMTARAVEATFTPLRKQLADLIAEIAAVSGTKKGKVSTKCLEVKLDPDAQHKFGLHVLRKMGFDLDAGRLDVTTHPFCSGMAPVTRD